MKERFETIKVNKLVVVEQEGMEITAFIAGVNSGCYGLPFVIQVRTWARKWFWRKFFFCEAKLDLEQVKTLRAECDKVIRLCEAQMQ